RTGMLRGGPGRCELVLGDIGKADSHWVSKTRACLSFIPPLGRSGNVVNARTSGLARSGPYFDETGRLSPMRLPDSDSILRLKIEFVAGRGLVLLVPRIDIAHGIASIFSRRMGISLELLTKRSFRLEFAPSLGKRQKETLFSIQPIDDGIVV